LTIAAKFGRPPEEVEQWDVYWFRRASDYISGQNIGERRRMAEPKQNTSRGRRR